MATNRVRLEPFVSQRATLLWKAQQTADRFSLGMRPESALLDPTEVGFACSGLVPGINAPAESVEAHRQSFSVSRSGRYLLHVRLRHEARPLPHSPFALTVVPGPGHHSTTLLQPASQPLRGEVGMAADEGCRLLLTTADRAGNRCIAGGAQVVVSCAPPPSSASTETLAGDMETSVTDNDDGTYLLTWRSNSSTHGCLDAKVLVNGHPAVGSPVQVQLVSTRPECSRTEVCSLGSEASGEGDVAARIARVYTLRGSTAPLAEDFFGGEGLKHTIAGVPTSILLRFRDDHGNPATPGAGFAIGMAIRSKDSPKLKVQELNPLEGVTSVKGPDGSGLQGLTYVATSAGPTELTVWCESTNGVRQLLPGFPCTLHVAAGEVSTAQSYVGEFSLHESLKRVGEQASLVKTGRDAPTKGGGRKGDVCVSALTASTVKDGATEGTDTVAGDVFFVRVYCCDRFHNAAALAEPSLLRAKVATTDGAECELPVLPQPKAGKDGVYDVRCETRLSGAHVVHVLVRGQSIEGSPMRCVVTAGAPVPSACRLIEPAGGTNALVAEVEHPATVRLVTHDRFGNACGRAASGLRVTGRLQLLKQAKQGHTDILMASNHTVTVEDQRDGTYLVKVTCTLAATVRLIVSMDKESGELKPLDLTFVKRKSDGTVMEPPDRGGQRRRGSVRAAGSVAAGTVAPLLGDALQAFVMMHCDGTRASYGIFWVRSGTQLVVSKICLSRQHKSALERGELSGSFAEASQTVRNDANGTGAVATCLRTGQPVFVPNAANSEMKRSSLAAQYGIGAIVFYAVENGVLELGCASDGSSADWGSTPPECLHISTAKLRQAFESFGASYALLWHKQKKTIRVVAGYTNEEDTPSLGKDSFKTFEAHSRAISLDPKGHGPVATALRTGEEVHVADAIHSNMKRAVCEACS